MMSGLLRTLGLLLCLAGAIGLAGCAGDETPGQAKPGEGGDPMDPNDFTKVEGIENLGPNDKPPVPGGGTVDPAGGGVVDPAGGGVP